MILLTGMEKVTSIPERKERRMKVTEREREREGERERKRGRNRKREKQEMREKGERRQIESHPRQ